MSAPPALHPLGVGELLDAAIYVYRKSFVTLIGIGAVIAIPLLLLQSAAALINAPVDPFFVGQLARTPSSLSPSTLSFVYLAATAITSLLGAIAGVFEAGALAYAVSERRMGRRVTIGGAYRQALRRWPALLGSAILIQLFSFAGFGFLFAPFFLSVFAPLLAPGNTGLVLGATLLSCVSMAGFIPALIAVAYVTVRWSITTPAIVLENLGALRGMGRSWRLVKGSFWRTFAVLLVVGVLVNLLIYIVVFAIQFGTLALLRNSVVLATMATSAGGVVVGAVIKPLEYAVLTLLYYDLRVRREGYDLQLALDQLKQSTAPAVTEGVA